MSTYACGLQMRKGPATPCRGSGASFRSRRLNPLDLQAVVTSAGGDPALREEPQRTGAIAACALYGQSPAHDTSVQRGQRKTVSGIRVTVSQGMTHDSPLTMWTVGIAGASSSSGSASTSAR